MSWPTEVGATLLKSAFTSFPDRSALNFSKNTFLRQHFPVVWPERRKPRTNKNYCNPWKLIWSIFQIDKIWQVGEILYIKNTTTTNTNTQVIIHRVKTGVRGLSVLPPVCACCAISVTCVTHLWSPVHLSQTHVTCCPGYIYRYLSPSVSLGWVVVLCPCHVVCVYISCSCSCSCFCSCSCSCSWLVPGMLCCKYIWSWWNVECVLLHFGSTHHTYESVVWTTCMIQDGCHDWMGFLKISFCRKHSFFCLYFYFPSLHLQHCWSYWCVSTVHQLGNKNRSVNKQRKSTVSWSQPNREEQHCGWTHTLLFIM